VNVQEDAIQDRLTTVAARGGLLGASPPRGPFDPVVLPDDKPDKT